MAWATSAAESKRAKNIARVAIVDVCEQHGYVGSMNGSGGTEMRMSSSVG